MRKNNLLKVLLLCLSICFAMFAFIACDSGTKGNNDDGGETPPPSNVYTITYNANGGYVSTTEKEIERGDSFVHPIPSRSGYEFECWLYNGDPYAEGVYTFTHDVVFVAQWKAIYRFNPETGEIKGFETKKETNTEINLPSTIDGVTVTKIGASAFAADEYLESITIPSTVQLIDRSAFAECEALKHVYFEDGSQLKTIGRYAFDFCNILTTINIPASVETIEDSAFASCSALEKVNFATSASLKTIGSYAFGECGLIKELHLPASVETISSDAFAACSNLLTVYLGENSKLKTIGDGAFIDCAKMQVFFTSNVLETIGAEAFSGCKALVSIILPKSVATIGSNAFSNCTSLYILSEASGDQAGWSNNFNPNSRMIGYNLQELTSTAWQKQTIAINRNEYLTLSFSDFSWFTQSAIIRSAIFNGRKVDKTNFTMSGTTLKIATNGVRTGYSTLTLNVISSGNAYIINTEQNIIDYKIGTDTEFLKFIEDVRNQPDDKLDDIKAQNLQTKEIHAILTNNVDLNGTGISSRLKTSPVAGTLNTSWSLFRGSLDGQGYCVKNFKIDRQGIFWHIDNTTIKNIAFTNFAGATGENQKAFLCWSAQDVLMENVYMQGEMNCELNKHIAGVCYNVSGITFNNFIIDIEFTYKASGSPYVAAIGKYSNITSASHNVYAISTTADAFSGGMAKTGHNYGLYYSTEHLKQAITSANLAMFDTNYWDITSGVPVWKNA